MDTTNWKDEAFHLVILYRLLECGDTIPLTIDLTDYAFIEGQLETMHHKGWVVPNADSGFWEVTDGGKGVRDKMVEMYDHLLHFEIFGAIDLTTPLNEDVSDDGTQVFADMYDPRFLKPDEAADREGVEDLRLTMMAFLTGFMADEDSFKETGAGDFNPYRMVFLQMLAEGEFRKGNIWFDFRLGTPLEKVQEIVDSAYQWTDLDEDQDTAKGIMQDIYTAGLLEQKKRDGDVCSHCDSPLAGMMEPGGTMCPFCQKSFAPPEPPLAGYACPKCEGDIYAGDARCKGCGAMLDFTLPAGTVTEETVASTEVVEEEIWSSDICYEPYGYYDPYDPYCDIYAFAAICIIF